MILFVRGNETSTGRPYPKKLLVTILKHNIYILIEVGEGNPALMEI